MIAEEYSNISSQKPQLTNQGRKSILNIYNCLKSACAPFKKAKNQPNLHLPLNENKLTQIFVEQVEVFIKPLPNIAVKNQYSDTFFGTKGVPDFYFHKVEEGVYHLPIIIFEAKILASSFSNTKREKEYVIGDKNNGGIERYKTEKHGKGLSECGLLGFVEDKDFTYWNTSINGWIDDLSKLPKTMWKSDEVLSETDGNTDYCILQSIAHRASNDVNLTHLWVLVN